LEKTYEQTLSGIDKEIQNDAQRLFQCLLVSIRPLRVEELLGILAVEFDTTAAPSLNEDLLQSNAVEVVLSACSCLIEVVNREGGQIVQFSHSTVKEFLTSDRLATQGERLSCYHILPEPAHMLLAQACLGVLLRLNDKIDRNAIGRFPLAPYAARHWIDHAQFGNVSAHIREAMERLFDPARSHFAAWVWLYDIDRIWIKPMTTTHPTRPEALPLYYATLTGFRGLVEHLIAADSRDVNRRGGSHTTPLHAASVKGHLDVASLLLETGADPNSRDNHGRSPLHRVSQGRQLVMVESSLEIARLLVNSGANVNATDDDDWTPLHAAAQSGYRDITELLLESGATLDVQNKNQRTALHVACANGKLDVSRFLIDRGSDMNSRDEEGFIALHMASAYGHVDVARLLLDRGSDVNVPDVVSWTPLHLASSNGRLDIAKLLVEQGANIDSQNDDDETPLKYAAGFGNLDIARFLVESGAAVSARDDQGWTPFHTASNCGHLHVAKFLLECGVAVDIRTRSEETSLYLASSTGKLDVIHFLIEHGADIYANDNLGWNSLHIASQNGYLEVVRMLIKSGIFVDIRNGT
jgi:ankyrin repeat protein